MDKTIALTPIMSEKAYALSQARNTYVFAVPEGTNKHTVARAVASQFEVTVTNVNITNISGKAKRTVRKNGRSVMGRQNATRKAYVTLKDGETLPVFAALEEDAKEAEKTEQAVAKATEKAVKKAGKETSKETKKSKKEEEK
jgi:large subunit ribosomal protein L23